METIVNRFAKVYTPVAVLACLLLIIVPAGMGKSDIKVCHLRLCLHAPETVCTGASDWPCICA